MIIFSRFILLSLLGCIWVWLAANTSTNIIASPFETFVAAISLLERGTLQTALLQSISVYFTGFLTAASIGVVCGILMGMWKFIGKTTEIFVFALAATPRVAFIPLIIVFLGIGFEAKVFVVFLGSVMPVIINTYAGVLSTDNDLLEMAKATGASSFSIYRSIVLPGAVPFVITGLRIGATIGLINVVVAELYTAVGGLGGLLALYGNTFRMAEYFTVVISLVLIGIIVTEILRAIEVKASRWRVS
jgi:ABC-type nitrate/sulfonate/bicarbonate transport system permease component